MKRIVCVVAALAAALAVALALAPAVAKAETPSGTWGTCSWEITDDGVLTVHPGVGAEQENGPFGCSSPWGGYGQNITKVVFAKEGERMVVAPINSCSLFAALSKVESFDLIGLDTSNVTDMSYMFAGCSSLAALDCSGFDTSHVTNMSGMFGTYWTGESDEVGCAALVTLNISSFDINCVSSMDCMFSGMESLKTFIVGAGFVAHENQWGDMVWSAPDGAWLAASDGARYSSQIMASRGVADTYTRDESVYTIGIWGTCPWEIDNDGTLTVHSGTGAEQNSRWIEAGPTGTTGYLVDNSPWIDYADHITAIVFARENGQNVIAPANSSALFNNLRNVVSIDFSGLDTSHVTDMGCMFSGCSSLSELDLSNFDTSNVTNMRYMFAVGGSWVDASSEKLTSLVSIDLSNFNTSNVTDMEGMFRGCDSLAFLDLSGLDTRCVTNMSYMFGGRCNAGGEAGPGVYWSGCESLTSLDLSSFDTRCVTTMANMFYGCTSLTTLDVSSFITSNVTSMAAMFYGCASLTSLNLSNFDTSHVTAFCSVQWTGGFGGYVYEGMFEGCTGLASLDVSNFDTSGADVLNGFFRDCASLRELELSSGFVVPEGSDANLVESNWQAASDGQVYSSAEVLARGVADSYTLSTIAFGLWGTCPWEIDSNRVLTIHPGVGAQGESYYGVMFVYPWHNYAERIVAVSVVEEEGEKVIAPADSSWLFALLSFAKTFDLSGLDVSNVENMDFMFGGCSNASTIYVSADWYDDGSAFSGSNMFTGCASLVGGNGTAYSEEHTDGEYARVDRDGVPGYFSATGVEPQLIDIADAVIAEIEDQTYTGEAIEPELHVTLGDAILVAGTDYTVEYAGNVEVGTATATITGIGGYTGTASATFEIVAEVPELAIVSQPEDATGAVGGTASFSVVATGDGLGYRWQWSRDDGQTWANSSASFVGYNEATMQVPITVARNGYLYRCVVTDASGATLASDAAKLTVAAAALAITAQPKDASGAVGETASFSVVATGDGLGYRWQWSRDSGQTWANSSSSFVGYNADTMQVPITAARNGYLYRCVVTDASGATATSDSARLTVTSAAALAITAQPKDATGAVGETASFSVAAVGDGLGYRWQWSRDDGQTWANSSSSFVGYNEATMQVPVTAARNGYLYRCVVTDASGATATSDAARLTVSSASALAITTQPDDASGAVGETATFSVAATGDGLSYRWQWSRDDGQTWANSSSTFVGYNADTMRVPITAVRNGYLYRCVVTDASGATLASDAARLTVLTGPTVTTQPDDAFGAVGETATFTVAATGDGLGYRWQWSRDGGQTWANSSASFTGYNEASMQVPITAVRHGYLYRCVVTDASGATAASEAAVLSVAGQASKIVAQPKDATGAVGATATFSVAAAGEGLSYRWQWSRDGGQTWANSSSSFVGYDSDNMRVPVTAVRDGYRYRCVVTDAQGVALTSDAATLTVG